MIKEKLNELNRRGSFNVKSMILLVVAIAIVGGLVASGSIFQPLNSTNLTAAGAPSWSVGIFGTIIAAILVTWFVQKLR